MSKKEVKNLEVEGQLPKIFEMKCAECGRQVTGAKYFSHYYCRECRINFKVKRAEKKMANRPLRDKVLELPPSSAKASGRI